MSIRVLAKLESLAASAPTESSRLTYRAKWACAAARLGQIAAARSEIDKLRLQNNHYLPQLTAWILIAEGMADHFEALSTAALDRFKRAHGLAVAIGDPEARSMAAAWMGASEFLAARYEDAARHAMESILHAGAEGALAKARAHLVIANCLNGAGALELAQVQYATARQFSIEASDISMQSAVLYNVAAFRVSRIAIDDALGDPVEHECRAAELEVNSIGNLDSGLGLESLKAMVPLLRAQLYVIGKRWIDADFLYKKFTSEACSHGQARHAPRFLAESALCQAMCGHDKNALRLVAEAIEGLDGQVDADDRAACHGRVSQCLAKLGDTNRSRAHLEQGIKSRAEFAEFQHQLRPRIVSIVSELLEQ